MFNNSADTGPFGLPPVKQSSFVTKEESKTETAAYSSNPPSAVSSNSNMATMPNTEAENAGRHLTKQEDSLIVNQQIEQRNHLILELRKAFELRETQQKELEALADEKRALIAQNAVKQAEFTTMDSVHRDEIARLKTILATLPEE